MKYCHLPFTQAIINSDGSVTTCNGGMMKKTIGNVFSVSSFDEIWNSEEAVLVRKSIYDQSFCYCNKEICCMPVVDVSEDYYKPILDNGFKDKNPPKWLRLAYDKSCILKCVTCRDQVFMMKEDETSRFIDMQKKLFPSGFLKNIEQLHLATAGDFFCSKAIQDFTSRISEQEYPNLKIWLLTHGLGFTRNNNQVYEHLLYAMDWIYLSVDAATKETYKKIRRNSSFDLLLKNISVLMKLRSRYNFKIRLNFVVQSMNYREIPGFVRLAKKIGVDSVYFQKLVNYGISHKYKKLAVHEPWHPEHREFINVLREPEASDSIVNWSNLKNLYFDTKYGITDLSYDFCEKNKWCRFPLTQLQHRRLLLCPNPYGKPRLKAIIYARDNTTNTYYEVEFKFEKRNRKGRVFVKISYNDNVAKGFLLKSGPSKRILIRRDKNAVESKFCIELWLIDSKQRLDASRIIVFPVKSVSVSIKYICVDLLRSFFSAIKDTVMLYFPKVFLRR